MPSSRWVILAVSTLAFMQVHVHRVGFAPLIPTFVADLGLTYAAAGTIMTAYFCTYTVAQIPIGLLADRWGSRRVMIVFMALLALGVVAFPLSRGYGESLLSRALVGLGAAAVWVPSMRLISEWFPARERGRVTGILSAGGGLGGTLALLVIPFLAELWGWRIGYATTLLPVLLTLALIVLFIRGVEGSGSRSAAGEVPGHHLPLRGTLGPLWQVLATRALWPFNITVLLFYGAYFSLVTWMPAFLVKHLALSQSQAGFVTSLLTAGSIVSWPVAGFLTDRLGRRKGVFLFSQASSCLVSLVFAWVVPGLSLWGAAAVSLATGIVLGGMITPFVMVVELFPGELAGTATSVANTFCFIGGLTIPVLLGRVVDVTGSFPAAFVVAGAIQALAFVTASLMREPARGGERVSA
ncbi:MAG: MFS transporter [Candidatus Rokubacteria bacterium]|nr:MFS transporter [Candidatus Rokubacteria bacterium]